MKAFESSSSGCSCKIGLEMSRVEVLLDRWSEEVPDFEDDNLRVAAAMRDVRADFDRLRSGVVEVEDSSFDLPFDPPIPPNEILLSLSFFELFEFELKESEVMRENRGNEGDEGVVGVGSFGRGGNREGFWEGTNEDVEAENGIGSV